MSYIVEYQVSGQRPSAGEPNTDYNSCLWNIGQGDQQGTYCGTFSATFYGNEGSDSRAAGFVTGFIGLAYQSGITDNQVQSSEYYNAFASLRNIDGYNYLAIQSTPKLAPTSRPYFCSLSVSVTGDNLRIPSYHSWTYR